MNVCVFKLGVLSVLEARASPLAVCTVSSRYTLGIKEHGYMLTTIMSRMPYACFADVGTCFKGS